MRNLHKKAKREDMSYVLSAGEALGWYCYLSVPVLLQHPAFLLH